MIEKIIELSILSGGLLPLMAILFFFNITVVIERVYFFYFLYKSSIGNIRKLEDSKFHFDSLDKNDHDAMTPSELIISLTNERFWWIISKKQTSRGTRRLSKSSICVDNHSHSFH